MNINKKQILINLSLCLGIVYALILRLGPEVADDAGFFLRYAENMLAGKFWYWNLGESPVWGASAPIYPVLLVPFLKMGLSGYASVVAVGVLLMSISGVLITRILISKFGVVAGVSFYIFLISDYRIFYWAGAGLETPLTILLISIAVWSILERREGALPVLIGALLMINKIDNLPFAVLFYLSLLCLDGRKAINNILLSIFFGLTFYIFAWLYFGLPVPNSFLTKAFHQNHMNTLNWLWFTREVTYGQLRKTLVALSIIYSATAIYSIYKNKFKVTELFVAPLFIVSCLTVHWLAYTVKYPFEPYVWYTLPTVYLLMIIGGISLGWLSRLLCGIYRNSNLAYVKNSLFFVLGIVALILTRGIYKSEFDIDFSGRRLAAVELVRANAGRWVDLNTDRELTMYSAWGNSALYAHRISIDGSFLNRKYEDGSLIEKYHPEIVIIRDHDENPYLYKYEGLSSDLDFEALKKDYLPIVQCSNRDFETDWHVVSYTVLLRKSHINKLQNDLNRIDMCKVLTN